MYLEEPAADKVAGKAALLLPRLGKELFIPALVCAGVSVILMRAGFFTFFFLVPLGVCAVVFGSAAAWLGAVLAALGNGLWLAVLSLRYGGGFPIGLDTLYFAVLTLGFAWVMAGNPPLADGTPFPPVRTVFRFIAASGAGALVFLAVIFSLGSDETFSAMLRSQIEAVSASYIAAAGTDAAQRAYLEQTLTADRIVEVFSMIILRGGALVSALFLLFFNRQTAFLIARLFKRQSLQGRLHKRGSAGEDLIGYHAPRRTIWVLSLCLPVILLCRIASLAIIEIVAWNILVMCATMFFAQGGGIVLFYFARRPLSAIMRLLCGVLIICVILSPGINVLAVALLILLGIAEIWLPLRGKREESTNYTN